MSDDNTERLDLIEQALRLLIKPGSIAELRGKEAVKSKKTGARYTAIGQYDNPAEMAHDAVKLGRMGATAIWYALNPVPERDDLNELITFKAEGVQDGEILARHNLLVDIDAVTAVKGEASSDAEHDGAIACGREIAEWLTSEYAWSEPIIIDSGNGCHLLYLIAEPNDAPTAALINRLLRALAMRYGAEQGVKIDPSVSNASRMAKLPYTLSRKGSNTAERPWRMAMLLSAPEVRERVTRERLDRIAALAPEAAPARVSEPYTGKPYAKLAWLLAWAEEHEVSLQEGIPNKDRDSNDRLKFILDDGCPWKDEHTTPDGKKDAVIYLWSNGKTGFSCFHGHCADRGWEDFRDFHDPSLECIARLLESEAQHA